MSIIYYNVLVFYLFCSISFFIWYKKREISCYLFQVLSVMLSILTRNFSFSLQFIMFRNKSWATKQQFFISEHELNLQIKHIVISHSNRKKREQNLDFFHFFFYFVLCFAHSLLWFLNLIFHLFYTYYVWSILKPTLNIMKTFEIKNILCVEDAISRFCLDT